MGVAAADGAVVDTAVAGIVVGGTVVDGTVAAATAGGGATVVAPGAAHPAIATATTTAIAQTRTIIGF